MIKIFRIRNRWLIILCSLWIILQFSCQSRPANKQPATGGYYTCPMHPQIHEDKPGYCPICGMKLVLVTTETNMNEAPQDALLHYLSESPTRTAIGSFKTMTAVKTSMSDTITETGSITFDPRYINNISARMEGQIEKLFVRYSGQGVNKGQPLYTIYSPELMNIQKDLLQAVEEGNTALIDPLKEKLINLGIPEDEITQIIQKNKPLLQLTVYSLYSGIALTPDNENTMMGIPLPVKAGMYVKRGQTLFSIQDVHHAWAVLNVSSKDMMQIKPGNPVNLYSGANPDKMISEHVDFIPPLGVQRDKTIPVRIYLNALPEHWKIGTLIHGKIVLTNPSNGWFVPLSAVNRLGMHDVVWVQDKTYQDVFHVTDVVTGLRTNDSIEIISGLSPGDKIALNAGYMAGSESFIQ